MRVILVERTLFLLVTLLVTSTVAIGQIEIPRDDIGVDSTRIDQNGFQVGIYGSLAFIRYIGDWNGPCSCLFNANRGDFRPAYGLSLSFPITRETALFLRFSSTDLGTYFQTEFSDTLLGEQVGWVGRLDVEYRAFTVEILLRIIASQEGFRLLVGPSIGFISELNLRVTGESLVGLATREYMNETPEGAGTTRLGFMMGVEYAFRIWDNLYVIPNATLDYGWKRIVKYQTLRPNYYQVAVGVAYQFD